jgi:hypothetical protein
MTIVEYYTTKILVKQLSLLAKQYFYSLVLHYHKLSITFFISQSFIHPSGCMDIQQEYTSFELKNNNNGSEGGGAAIDWRNAYVPTYIPDGYKISDSTNSELLRRIKFD